MAEIRYDVGGLRPVRRMPDGRVVVDAYFTRAGVFPYTRKDGSVERELRLPEHVFDRASMQSFANLPVTNDHPDVGLLDSRTARSYAVGATGDSVTRDGERMRGQIVVWDAKTIAEMDAGKLQISNGYTCDLVRSPGVHPQYGAYDSIQTNIVGNHSAIVADGRAGPVIRARMDASSAVMSPKDPSACAMYGVEATDDGLNAEQRNALGAESFAVSSRRALPIQDPRHVRAAMARFGQEQFQSSSEKRSAYEKIVSRAKKLGIDPAGFVERWTGKLDDAQSVLPTGGTRAITCNMDPEKALAALNQKIAELETSSTQLTADVTAQTKRADAAEAARDMYKAKADELEAKRVDARDALEAAAVKTERDRADKLQGVVDEHDKKFDEAVKTRSLLIARASVVLGAEKKLDALTNREITIEAIKHLDSKQDVTEARSDAALDTVFGFLYADHVKGAEGLARMSATLSSDNVTRARADEQMAPRKSRAQSLAGPLPSSKLKG